MKRGKFRNQCKFFIKSFIKVVSLKFRLAKTLPTLHLYILASHFFMLLTDVTREAFKIMILNSQQQTNKVIFYVSKQIKTSNVLEFPLQNMKLPKSQVSCISPSAKVDNMEKVQQVSLIFYFQPRNKQKNKQKACFIAYLFRFFRFFGVYCRHLRLSPQQIININMQRKKPDIVDYKLGSSPQNYNELFDCNRPNDYNTQPNHQAFFMKYASSIIQVVHQQKLEKSNLHGAEADFKSPIYEISEVNYYQTENLPRNSQHKQLLSNNYNNFGEGFKKKNSKKHILTYNFTNITLFLNHVSKIQRNGLYKAFSSLKTSVPKQKNFPTTQPPKSRSSFHSDYTTSTSNDDQGLKKLNNLQQIHKKNQDIKQSIDQMKGWIQFKLLIVKSEAFRHILSCSKYKPVCKKQCNLKPSYGLSPFENQQSLSLVHQEEQESLVYTADQNFQFSQKEITVSTPQKTSLEEKLNPFATSKHVAVPVSSFGSVKNHESVVEVYKFSRVKRNKLQESNAMKVAMANPVKIKFEKQIKCLVNKANTFQLPLISQFYLKNDQKSQCNQVPLKKDSFMLNQSENCFANDQIKKQFQTIKTHIFQDRVSKQKNQQKSKASLFEEKQSTLMAQIKSNINSQSVKNAKQYQFNTFKSAHKAAAQQAGLHKVQDYYFPCVQSKINNLIVSKSDIKYKGEKQIQKESQRKGLQTSDQKQVIAVPKKVRFQESLVDNFLETQHKVKQTKKNVINSHKQKKIISNVIGQSKIKQKANVGFTSPQPRMSPSPQSINIQNNMGNNMGNNAKRKPFYSPPSTMTTFNHLNQHNNPQLMAKAVQQEYNQFKPDQNKRFSAQDRGIPQQSIQPNNIYQLNYPNYQPKQIGNNMMNFHKTETRTINSPLPFKQTPQPINPKINNLNLPNRPASRVSPSPPPSIHLNIPSKCDFLPYGVATSRQHSQKKISFHSPQNQRKNFPQNNFLQDLKPKFQNYRRQDYNEQYFVRHSQGNKFEEKAVNFNNRYYTSGVSIPSRPNQMISPNTIQPNFTQDTKNRRVIANQRPHSSFRESTERFNIFSNCSPMDSQLQHIQRSNNFTSRNSSELNRPKSMNEKIYVTMRRER